jgi:glutamine---fructose-6-phosphate transaminase (isomerizing)
MLGHAARRTQRQAQRSAQACRLFTQAAAPASSITCSSVLQATGAEQNSSRRRSSAWLGVAAGAAAAAALASQREPAQACGIVGIVGGGDGHRREDAREMLLEGLSILRNRGYDSAGLATIDGDNNIVVSKFASRGTTADSIDLLRNNSEAHSGHVVGIAHTR